MALYIDGSFHREWAWVADRNHSEYIFACLKEAVECLGGISLQSILVGAGPGSYGGVRVALAVADALALSYGATVVSIPSWQGIVDKEQGTCMIIADARRNGWAIARFDAGTLSPLTILTTKELQERVEAESHLTWISTESALHLETHSITGVRGDAVPSAKLLAQYWLMLSPLDCDRIAVIPPAPLYVRPPHITPAKLPPWLKKREKT